MSKYKTYAEKLRDPKWQKKRLEIMERDKFICCQCRSKTKTLNVHHRYYAKSAEPWEYDDDALVTLCEDCHKLVECQVSALQKAIAAPSHLFSICQTIAAAHNSEGPFSAMEFHMAISSIHKIFRLHELVMTQGEDEEDNLSHMQMEIVGLLKWISAIADLAAAKVYPNPFK